MIDIQTFMLVLALGNVAFAMLMAGYARSGSRLAAMHYWKWAKLVQGCAHLLSFLRPDLPLPWLVAAANTTLIVGVMFEAAAYCTFFAFRHWQRVLFPATAAGLAVYYTMRWHGASAAQLTVLMSLVLASLSGTMGLALARPRGEVSVLHRIIVANNLVFFSATLLRAYTGIAHGGLDAFTPDAVQTFTYISGYMLMIVNGFGFLLLCKESDDRKLALLASTDSLTGLLNRRAFFERAAAARTLSARLRQPVGLMMLDLDHFKRLNDCHGHAAGDTALCAFAATARGLLREHDSMGRLGGEEFALILPGTGLAGSLQAAERLRAAVALARPVAVTVSVGVVLVDPAEDIHAALARADRALYAAKAAGRNQVACGEACAGTPACALRCA